MFGSRTSALLDTGAAENAISFASAVAQLNTQLNKTAVEVVRERLERIAKLDPRYRGSTTKIKRGLSGMVNGSRTSAFLDTDAAENVISLAFAEEKQLPIKTILATSG